MTDIRSDFRQFFLDIHGRPPFPWQEELAQQVCTDGWPAVIALPTGSGKTACLDIAVFALARGASAAPRRIFYIVDRRLVVNEAFLRMQKLREALRQPATPALRQAANSLFAIAHDHSTEPLAAFALHGGAWHDESWVRTPLQPTLIASTVDQIGSRLLFRGYGISPNSAPVHAALIANDSLILLDEAHASRAFSQTLDHVQRYRTWADEPVSLPLRFVEMTATPQREGERFGLTPADRENEELKRRLRAPKPTTLRQAAGKRDDWKGLAVALVNEALDLAKAPGARRIAILCNRVRTARAVYDLLQAKRATLVIGRMRPLDREHLYETRLAHLKSGTARDTSREPEFVVATQTLEVGADLDFDILVTEIASLDAILQRFGRLNRMGQFDGARGAVVAAKWQLDARKPDPIYGTALIETWNWLQAHAADGQVSMQIEGADGKTIPERAALLTPGDRERLVRPGPAAPILLAAHLDTLVQTSPRPSPEPDIALFLHGQAATPESYIVWRGDLTAQNQPYWREFLEFCPPLPAEALPVRTAQLQRWLSDEQPTDDTDADLEGLKSNDEEAQNAPRKRSVGRLWRDGKLVENSSNARPGDYLILPATENASVTLGQIPDPGRRDLADLAHWRARKWITLRLHPGLDQTTPEGAQRAAARAEIAADPGAREKTLKHFRDLWLPDAKDFTLARRQWTGYPDQPEDSPARRFRARLARRDAGFAEVKLNAHLNHVTECAAILARRTLPDALASAVFLAAQRHDWGKADPRFQAMLRGNSFTGRFSPVLLAKSADGSGPGNGHGLPNGFRHEMLSLSLAESNLDPAATERDLILHLIASHHGRARPFAPVVPDNNPPAVSYNGASISADRRRSRPAHALDSGISERFWSLTRRFGWWGLAYLEATLRLADWEASQNETSEVYDDD